LWKYDTVEKLVEKDSTQEFNVHCTQDPKPFHATTHHHLDK
jgi:hypothetical protein